MPVEWSDPPPPTRGTLKWRVIADELKSRPNTWALIARDVSPATATNINKGVLVAFRPPGTFESRTANRDDKTNRCDIYARYVGDEAGS
jgi:hypothetical protein